MAWPRACEVQGVFGGHGGESLLPASSPRGGPWCPRPGGQFPSCPCWCPAGFRKVGGAGLPRPGRCSDMHTTHMRLCHPRPFRSETVGPAQLHRVKLRCETGTEEARPPARPAGLPEPPPAQAPWPARPSPLEVPLSPRSENVTSGRVHPVARTSGSPSLAVISYRRNSDRAQ